jgi:hypothetical protein
MVARTDIRGVRLARLDERRRLHRRVRSSPRRAARDEAYSRWEQARPEGGAGKNCGDRGFVSEEPLPIAQRALSINSGMRDWQRSLHLMSPAFDPHYGPHLRMNNSEGPGKLVSP